MYLNLSRATPAAFPGNMSTEPVVSEDPRPGDGKTANANISVRLRLTRWNGDQVLEGLKVLVTPQFARLKALWISICAKRNISAGLLGPTPVSAGCTGFPL